MSRLGNARGGWAERHVTRGPCEQFPGLDRARRQGGRHRPDPGDGRRAEGRQRPPRHRHEPGPGRLPAVPEGDAAQPRRPALAGPRPFRALGRALLAHALPPALPRRLGPRARRHQGAAHLGQQDPRPPRVRPHRGRGDHDRAAGPGRRQRGRHGDGRPPRARPARPQRRARRLAVRPPDLRDLLRRRHPGGRQQRGLLAGRHPEPRQPHGDLRRQPDLHRGRHQHRAVRGHRGPLRGLRLARADRRLDQRRHRLRRGRAGPPRRPGRGRGGHRPAQLHQAPHHHRLARPRRAGHRRQPRLRARRGGGGGHQAGPRLRPRADVRGAGRRDRAHPPRRRPRQAGAGRVGRRLPALDHEALGRRVALRAAPDPHAPPGLGRRAPDVRGERQGRRDPQGLGRGHQRDRGRGARAVGRLRRPRRLQQHHHRGRAVVPAQGALQRDVQGRPLRRPRAALRHPRARDGRDPQRHRPARRHPRLRRHLPPVLRLHAPGGAARRADGPAGDLRLDPRLRGPRRGRPDPPADRAPRRAARDPRASTSSARPTPTRPPPAGRPSSSTPTGRPASR